MSNPIKINCPQGFYTQTEMFKHAQENNHSFYFSVDKTLDNASKIYGSTKNLDEFLVYYNSLDDSDKNFYELIKKDSYHYEYYDLDFDLPQDYDEEKYSNLSYFLWFENIRNEFLKSCFPLKKFSDTENFIPMPNLLYKPNWIILSASNLHRNNQKLKLSLHIINTNCIFGENIVFRNYYNLFKDFVEKNNSSDFSIDWSVSSANRNIRIINSSKIGQNRPLKFWNEINDYSPSIKQSFITNACNDPQLKHKLFFESDLPFNKNKITTLKPLNNFIDSNETTVTKNKGIKYIQELLSLLNFNRVNDYNDWITVCFALKNSNYDFDIFKNWSKLSPKFNEDYCLKLWNTSNENNNLVTLGTIHFFAKNDNPINYIKFINKYKKEDSDFPFSHDLEINKKYIPESFYSHYINLYDIIAIRSNMNSGKTFTIPTIFNQYKNIIVVYSRITLCKAILNNWKHHGFELYSDIKDYKINLIKHNRIIIQLDSIHRLMGPCDLLILDEIETTHEHLCGSKKLNKTVECYSSLNSYIKKTNKIIVADANLKDETLDLFFYKRKNSIIKINNTYNSLSHINCQITSNKHELSDKIFNLLELNKNIVIPTSSQIFGEMIEKQINEKFPSLKTLRIDSKNNNNKNIPVNEWSDYNVLIYSPSVTAGVSFEKEHFHSLCAYFPKFGNSSEGKTQMLLRVRKLIDNDMFIYCQQDSKTNSFPTDDKSITDFINNKINEGHKDFKTDGLKIDNYQMKVANTIYFKLFRFYIKKRNISLKYSTSYFIRILKNHGINISFSNIKLNQKLIQEFNILNKNTHEEIKVEDAKKIVNAKILDDISLIDSKKELSDEDLNSIKRFRLCDAFDKDHSQPLDLDWTKNNINYINSYKIYKLIKHLNLEDAIELMNKYHNEDYYYHLEQNYEKTKKLKDEGIITSDEESLTSSKEDSDDDTMTLKKRNEKRKRKIIKKKNINKTVHYSIHYKTIWRKTIICLNFLKQVGFKSLEDLTKIKLDYKDIHNYCKENEKVIRSIFDCKIMEWDDELNHNEKNALSKYVNQKLESVLGIRITPTSKGSKSYNIHKCFIL